MKGLEESKNHVMSRMTQLSTMQGSLKEELNHSMEEMAELQAVSVQTDTWRKDSVSSNPYSAVYQG